MITAVKEIHEHYTQADLSNKILTALKQAGKDVNALTREDIAPVDEFHIRGRAATIEMGKLAGFQPGAEVLDLGCGIGGPARTLMTEFDCRVTGVDLIDEYIQAARILNTRSGLDGGITFEQSNAMDLPFQDNSFDAVFAQHVTMNIEDKTRLAQEVRRVLRPGGQFILYEICAGQVSPAYFPVPWAGDAGISYLVDSETLRISFEKAGFETVEWRDVSAISLGWNQELVSNMIQRPADVKPFLGLNLLMGATAALKVKNMMKNLQEDRIRVFQGVMQLSEQA